MSRRNRFLNRWKTEYDFRTFAAAAGSLAVTFFFAVSSGIVWFVILLLSVAAIVKGIRQIKGKE